MNERSKHSTFSPPIEGIFVETNNQTEPNSTFEDS